MSCNRMLVAMLGRPANLILSARNTTHIASGQSEEYSKLTSKALALYYARDYKNSALTYSEAFKSLGWKGYSYDHYNATCSWTLVGFPDNAFFYLQSIADKANYSDYDHISTDGNLCF